MKTRTYYVSKRIDVETFLRTHPECRNLSHSLLACHLSTVFHQTFTTKMIEHGRRLGYFTLKIARKLNPVSVEARKLFADLYAKLFVSDVHVPKVKRVTPCKVHADCFVLTFKGTGETQHLLRAQVVKVPHAQKNGKIAHTFSVLPNVRITHNAKQISNEHGQIETVDRPTYTIIDDRPQGRVLGTVYRSLYSIWNKYSDNIGMRKGLNSRLWYSAVQFNDIIQEQALTLWVMVLENHPLLSDAAQLHKYLVTAGQKAMLKAMEYVEMGEDNKPVVVEETVRDLKGIAYAGNVKEQRLKWHRGEKRENSETKRVSYRQRRIYNLSALDDLRETEDGVYALIQRDDVELIG